MTSLVRAAVAAFALSMIPAMPVLAQEHDEVVAAEHADPAAHGALNVRDALTSRRFVWSAINFTALVVLLYFLARKPIASFLATRRANVETQLKEAAELKREAEELKRTYDERLAKLNDEVERVRKEMHHAGEAERDRIVAEAEAKAVRLRKETEFLIEQLTKQLRIDLTREAVDAAIAAAEHVLKGVVSSADQERLARDYLERLRGEGEPQTKAKPAPVVPSAQEQP